MEYIYGKSTRNGETRESLKTVGDEHSNLSGYISTVLEFPDGTKITDHCRIVEKYASKEASGKCYDWYIIDSHYRETDTTGKTMKAVHQISANLDYISMMSGVEIPGGDVDGTQQEV